ncbi:MAG: hypothetical protein IAE87_18575 [Rhodobacteraceae bacterium]|jgi:hypothetical protein|nr:hypothetical protein [Paracoccaceae bacterium]
MPARLALRTGLVPISALLVLAACGTPEYRAERSVCQAEWTERIPPRYEQRLIERISHEQRPTGRSTCTTTGATTNCVAEMVTVAIPYMDVETVDVNATKRRVQVEACAAKACQQKFGNAECTVPGGG